MWSRLLGGIYTISQATDGTFQVSGGSLEGDGTSVKDLTDAIETILNNSVDKKVTIVLRISVLAVMDRSLNKAVN